MTFPQAAYVLALSQVVVRVLEIAPDVPAYELAVPDLPSDAASAVGKASIGDRSPVGRIRGSEGQKVRMRQYARRVDEAIRPVLAGGDLPLILAATEPLDAIFRSVCTYTHLAESTSAGSPIARRTLISLPVPGRSSTRSTLRPRRCPCAVRGAPRRGPGDDRPGALRACRYLRSGPDRTRRHRPHGSRVGRGR